MEGTAAPAGGSGGLAACARVPERAGAFELGQEERLVTDMTEVRQFSTIKGLASRNLVVGRGHPNFVLHLFQI